MVKKSSQVGPSALGGLEHIFGSPTRETVLRFLLLNDEPHFLREIARQLNNHLNSVRREIDRFVAMGLVVVEPGPERKKFYRANKQHILFPELKALVVKSHLLIRSKFLDQLKKTGKPEYALVTGFFTGVDCPTDIILVGTINRKELEALLRTHERELGREINYTILTLAEFRYRQSVADRFIQQILQQPHLIIVDRLNHHEGGS